MNDYFSVDVKGVFEIELLIQFVAEVFWRTDGWVVSNLDCETSGCGFDPLDGKLFVWRIRMFLIETRMFYVFKYILIYILSLLCMFIRCLTALLNLGIRQLVQFVSKLINISFPSQESNPRPLASQSESLIT